MLIGIEKGQSLSYSAGATRQSVSLAVSEDGKTVTISDRKFEIEDNTLVLWFKSWAGTWHGFSDPNDLKTMKANQAPAANLRGVIAATSSGGGDGVAAVIRVDNPVCFVTSDYLGRRGWMLNIVTPGPNGLILERINPVEYRARFAPVEKL